MTQGDRATQGDQATQGDWATQGTAATPRALLVRAFNGDCSIDREPVDLVVLDPVGAIRLEASIIDRVLALQVEPEEDVVPPAREHHISQSLLQVDMSDDEIGRGDRAGAS